MLIAVDAGKFSTKALAKKDGQLIRFCCRTKLDEAEGGEIMGSNTYSLNWQGKSYILGEQACNTDYDVSKAKLAHKLAAFLSVCKLGGEEVSLVLGCPIITFSNVEARESYKQFMSEDKVDLWVDGKRHKFSIVECIVLPEGVGVPYNMVQPSQAATLLLPTIDIGGLNCSGVIFEHLRPLKQSIFTINEGANMLLNKIKRELNRQLGLNYQDYEIPHLVFGENTNHRIIQIITTLMQEQIGRIVEEAKKYNWNVQGLPLYFTGGGSLLMEKQIKSTLPDAIVSKTPIWDNANGFLRIGEMMDGSH